jgi:hypothetical protein
MVTIRELAGALQHSILHQTSTYFTGFDHGLIETLTGLGNAQFGTSKAPLCLRAYRRHVKVIIRHFTHRWDTILSLLPIIDAAIQLRHSGTLYIILELILDLIKHQIIQVPL